MELEKYKSSILNIIIIALSLFIAFNIYRIQDKNIKLLRSQKALESKRSELLKSIKHLEEAFLSYKNFFEKKDVSLIINNINTIAKDSDVKIIAIKPENEKSYSEYINTYPFSLRVDADNYHSIGKFINKIENDSGIFYMVGSINIKPAAGQEAKYKQKFSLDLALNTFFLKKN